jgi:probable H4MPT-linked C1 transfer pathway protein
MAQNLSVLGLDIGGANLKAANTAGMARLVRFELWKRPRELESALRCLLDKFPPAEFVAVTMTGELCDCFESRQQGVLAILEALESAVKTACIGVWLNDGQLVSVDEVRRAPVLAASTNWLALATFACRLVPSDPALLIDIGSTTTDIIPLWNGKPAPTGRTDCERLACRELVYSGVRRTPICALLGLKSVAAELFATTLDAYLVLGQVAEDDADTDTADSRPATVAAAMARLARMRCADREMLRPDAIESLAEEVRSTQTAQLCEGIRQVVEQLPQSPRTIILAGSGEFLGRHALRSQELSSVRQISLAERLGPVVSQAACAYAVAVLALEMHSDGRRA